MAADEPDPAAIATAAEVIRRGGLVAFPTETVYGLGGNALDPDAIHRIYAAKGRPSHNPLIAHCADIAMSRALAAEWSADAEALAQAFWPGPLTLVVPKQDRVPDAATAGLRTVAVRVPAHPVARALLERCGLPIAAPSANLSTELSPTTADHVLKSLVRGVDIVLDAGATPVGIESTVVDVSGPQPVLLRPGTLSLRDLERVLGRRVATPRRFPEGRARPAPGMLARHYAPRAELLVVPHGSNARLRELASSVGEAGRRVAALLIDAEAPEALEHVVRMPPEPHDYARTLYATLHEIDDRGHDLVLVEEPPDHPAWDGVRDRLRRAAEPR